MIYSRIAGTGRYLPERIMTNFDLEKIVDTTDEWIRTRTGVERRHVVEEDQTTSDMCVRSAQKAMDDAGVTPADIDMVITGTTSPDVVFPNVSSIIQHRLGIPACPAFSLEAACSSFIYALTVADKFIKTGEAKCVLVTGADKEVREVYCYDADSGKLMWRKEVPGHSGEAPKVHGDTGYAAPTMATDGSRLVLRLWNAHRTLDDGSGTPIWIGHVARERPAQLLGLFTYARGESAGDEVGTALAAEVASEWPLAIDGGRLRVGPRPR